MSKGTETRAAILTEALSMVSVQGLNGLSLGNLATRTGMSKSGLYAHFGSKEELQRATLALAVEWYTADVVEPALRAPRGEPRLRAVFENYLGWSKLDGLPGGCPLITAGIELDDQPGPLRDFLTGQQQRWIEFLSRAAEIAIDEGQFRADLDTRQFAFEFTCITLGYNHSVRLLRSLGAEDQARAALESLLERARRSP